MGVIFKKGTEMNTKGLSINFLLIFLLGCSDTSPNDNTNPLMGNWLSNCYERSDNNGVFINYAIKNLIINNTESMSNTVDYTDINCTILNGTSSLITEDYTVGEEVVTTDGSMAQRITLTSEHIFSGTLITVTKEAIYRITGVELNFGDFINGNVPSLDYTVTYVKQ